MDFALERALRNFALLAAALVLGMLATFIGTGIGQDPLQYVHPAADYGQLLLRNPPVLRAVIGLDNLFAVAYSALFVLWGSLLWQRGAPRGLLLTGLALMLATGLLDLLENFHFLAMLAGAEQGHAPADAEIGWQALQSMFKFHVSYLGLLLLGLALPREGARQRVLSALMVFVQWPVGVAIYVLPQAAARPLVFVRFAFFLAAFALLASIHGRRSSPTQGRGAAGSGARA